MRSIGRTALLLQGSGSTREANHGPERNCIHQNNMKTTVDATERLTEIILLSDLEKNETLTYIVLSYRRNVGMYYSFFRLEDFGSKNHRSNKGNDNITEANHILQESSTSHIARLLPTCDSILPLFYHWRGIGTTGLASSSQHSVTVHDHRNLYREWAYFELWPLWCMFQYS